MTRTALITGATSGIGRSCAVAFVRAGWRVVALGRREDRLRELSDELGVQVAVVPVDVREHDSLAAAVAALPEPWRQVDLLINNAGTAYRSPLQDASHEQVEAVVDTNIKALVALTQLLLPGLITRRGAVINVGSTAANYPHGRSIVYGASKAFIAHFTMGLRSDLHGTGVRVSVVEPGRTTTEIFSDSSYEQLTADDVAASILAIAELPPHVNVNKLELMPVSQSLAGYQFATRD